MGAPIGNKFWEARSSHGRAPIFESPEDLHKACNEYFEWCHENPLYEMKPFVINGEVVQEPVYKPRAFTLGGLCVFLDIDRKTWDNYRDKDGFFLVTRNISENIRDQKFVGAAAGLFNANIIARDLGLREATESKVEVTHTLSKMSEDELDNLIEDLTNGES
jgi:hypothetical protein